MELRQTKTVMDVRRGYLMGVLGATTVSILILGIICNYITFYQIPIFTVAVFAIFIIVLSIFYDIFKNSTYRIFIVDGEIYIYYPTYSSRAGNEFIFYKVDDVSFATTRGSSIVFDGHVTVVSEGVERDGMAEVQDAAALFADVFSEDTHNVYQIHKRFRISRIFEGEHELMGILQTKKRIQK